MIYLILERTNAYLKIGYSTNPKNRKISLQTSNPFRLELICVRDGEIEDERKLQHKYWELCVSGEWFKYDERIVREFFGEGTDLEFLNMGNLRNEKDTTEDLLKNKDEQILDLASQILKLNERLVGENNKLIKRIEELENQNTLT